MRLRYLFTALVLVAAMIQPVSGPGNVAAEAPPPLAVLMACQGEVTVARADGSTVRGTFGMPLAAGDEVRTGKDGGTDILFENGNYISIGASSSMTVRGSKAQNGKIEPTKPMGDNGFEVAQSYLKLKSAEGTSSIAGLRGDRGEELRAVSPRQTRILDDRPRFMWESDDASAELRLTLYNDTGVLWKSEIDGATELEYPADAPVLVTGITYSWTVETTDPLKFPPLRSKAAFFELISDEERTSLAAALNRIDNDGSLSPISRHVMRASVFFNDNLLADAVFETEKAVDLVPDDTALKSILARLYNEVGRTDEAMAIYDQILDKP